jgi:hypothetical protein
VALREDAREAFLPDLRKLGRGQRELVRKLMAEIRADPLTLRTGWTLLPFPWRPGTVEASVNHVAHGTISIRFAVETDDAGTVVGIVWFRALVE